MVGGILCMRLRGPKVRLTEMGIVTLTQPSLENLEGAETESQRHVMPQLPLHSHKTSKVLKLLR